MKRIFTVVLFFLASTAIINAQTQKGYRDEKVERELIELVRKWDNASVKRDIDLLLADEFSLSGTTKKEYLAFIKPLLHFAPLALGTGSFDTASVGGGSVAFILNRP